MSLSPGAFPWRVAQAARTRGSAQRAAMCGRLAMPIGPRASAMVSSTPNSAKVSTKAPIGAREP